MIFNLACLFSDIARSLKNDDNPADFEAIRTLRRQKDSTKLKEILPVEVNVGVLIKTFNDQIQELGDKVPHLGNQLQIIKENEKRSRNAFEAKLESCSKEGKTLEEEVDRLKNENAAIKAENERLKNSVPSALQKS